MARKRIYKDPKVVVNGVSMHSELAAMTAALASKARRPTSYIIELALASYMESPRLQREVEEAQPAPRKRAA